MLATLFGSALREKILLYLLECGEGYGLELSRNFGASLYAVQNQVRTLEKGGILMSRSIGKTRLYSINPSHFLRPQLEALLRKNLEALPPEEINRFYRPGKKTVKLT